MREQKKEERRKTYETKEPAGAKLTQLGSGMQQNKPPPIAVSSEDGEEQSSAEKNSPRMEKKTGIGFGLEKSPSR